MKKVLCLTIAIACLAIHAGQAAAGQNTGSLVQRIQSTSEPFFADQPGNADLRKNVTSLVDIVSEIAAEDKRLPAEFTLRTRKATTIFRRDPLAEEARQAANDAYKVINDGKGFSMPPSVSSIRKAKDFGRKLIESSLEAARTGRTDQAAKDLLEFVLSVITPMMR